MALRSIPRCNPAFTYAEAVAHYEASTAFAEDALGDLANTAVADISLSLMGEIECRYRLTPEYESTIQDHLDGFRS